MPILKTHQASKVHLETENAVLESHCYEFENISLDGHSKFDESAEATTPLKLAEDSVENTTEFNTTPNSDISVLRSKNFSQGFSEALVLKSHFEDQALQDPPIPHPFETYEVSDKQWSDASPTQSETLFPIARARAVRIDETDRWLLIQHVREGDIEQCQNIVTKYTSDALMEIRDGDYLDTLVHFAVQSQKLEMLRLILSIVPPRCMTITNTFGQNSLHHAAVHGDPQIIAELINRTEDLRMINALDRYGCSPLGRAVLRNHTEVGSLFLPYLQPDTAIISGVSLDTLFFQCDVAVVQNFFKYCRNSDRSFWLLTMGTSGRTMLHMAMMAPSANRDYIFRIILTKVPLAERASFIESTDCYGLTPCALAAFNGRLESLSHFLRVFEDTFAAISSSRLGSNYQKVLHAILNKRTSLGSPYFLATTRGHKSCAELLKSYGARTDAIELCGYTPTDWSLAISGVISARQKPRLFRSSQVVEEFQYEQFSEKRKIFQTEERVRLLEKASTLQKGVPPEEIYTLAYHYFCLIDRYAYQSLGFEARRTMPFGMKQGTTLYALACQLEAGREISATGEFSAALGTVWCQSCGAVLPPKSARFVCTACPLAEFCMSCNNSKAAMRRCKCPGSWRHIWALVNPDDYKFEVAAGALGNSYLRTLWEEESKKRNRTRR